jgi:YVTN family beta-propeller protein
LLSFQILTIHSIRSDFSTAKYKKYQPNHYLINKKLNVVIWVLFPLLSIVFLCNNFLTFTYALHEDGPPFIYLLSQASNNLSIINITTNRVVANIPVGSQPVDMRANVAQCAVPEQPEDFSFSTNYNCKIYVLNQGSKNLSVIHVPLHIEASKAVTTIPVGLKPTSIASIGYETLYVTNTDSNNVSVINATTNKVVAIVPVGLKPTGITSSFSDGKLYVTNTDSNNVSVIDGNTDKVIGTMEYGGHLPIEVREFSGPPPISADFYAKFCKDSPGLPCTT